MWRALILTVLLGATALPATAQPWPGRDDPPPRERPRLLRDDRHVWRYEITGGRFEYEGRGRWVQHRDLYTPLYFRETDRTRAYVEVYDRSRDCHARLYDDMLYQYYPDKGWLPAFAGRWVD
jgi:hypothetical protein